MDIDEWFKKTRYRFILDILYQFSLGIFIPIEYKWIRLETKGEQIRIFCFGLEFDYYDNSDDVLFEDLKLEMKKRGISTKWTKTDDPYFSN